MQRADTLDRLLILAALLLFGLVCIFVIKRRIIDRGLRLVGVVRKILPRRDVAMEKGVKEAVKSLAATATSLVGPATTELIASHVAVPAEAGTTVVLPPAPTQLPTHEPALDDVVLSSLIPLGDASEGTAGGDAWQASESPYQQADMEPVLVRDEL
jgi:hypothetical protein